MHCNGHPVLPVRLSFRVPTKKLTWRAAQRFKLVASGLLAGGLLLVLLDLIHVAVQEPAALASPHRYAAALLPAAIVLAALLALPLTILSSRLGAGQVANLKRASAGCVGSLLVALVASWALLGRHSQLPLDYSLVVGTACGGAMIAIGFLWSRKRPPPQLLWAALLWGTFIALQPFHRLLSQYAILPLLVLWPLAALLPLPRRGSLAIVAALASVAGLVGYSGDRAGVSILVRRSAIASPMAQGVRFAVDFDSDGFSAILAGGDCDDFDAGISPRALEVVGNGVDDNCLGGDLAAFEPVGSGTRGGEQPLTPLPDVVILSLDAVRADHVTKELMPNVAALAERGIYAPVAYTSAPHTGIAVVGLMSSTPGIDSRKYGRFFGYEPQIGLVLKEAGYRSVAIHCLIDLVTDMVQGFDFVDNQLGPRCQGFPGTTAKAMADIAIRYLEEGKGDTPLFLWAHFTDPHLPYFGGYRKELARVDEQVGRVLEHIRPNTIVVLVSDHGESFGSHGFLGHIWRLDEEMLRVLLVVAGPQVPTSRVSWPASLLDVAPTLTEILGLPVPVGWQGASLLRDPGERAIVFESTYREQIDLQGLRKGDYKITRDKKHGSYELYNVAKDPQDEHNLVSSQPKVFKEMRRELGQVFDRLYNDRAVLRKLQLLDSRPNQMPPHSGPLW